MADRDNKRLSIVIVSEEQILTLAELCRGCALPAERVLSMVEYGIIEPLEQSSSPTTWQFSAQSATRLQAAIRLQRDLELNLAGAALALDLMDEVKALRRMVDVLRRD